MAKDPAFLFYPNDWIGGTMGMTFEEKGAYMELLMMQFNRGHMTSHMIGQAVGQFWDKIKDKFVQDDKGLWYNVRLEVEKENRAKYTESRRNNVSGANQYTKKERKKRGHMTSHMEDVNENENINGILNKRQNIKISITDHEKLVSQLGLEITESCYNYLSDYKIEKGYKTKNDYLTIKRWVIDAVKNKKNGKENKRIITDQSKPGTEYSPL